MGPVALVFLGVPSVLAAVDGGLKWIVQIRNQRRADKRVEEVGEPTKPPATIHEVDDDMLFPIAIDALVPGHVIKKLGRSEIWREVERGADRAELDKKGGSFPSCKGCGRMHMN